MEYIDVQNKVISILRESWRLEEGKNNITCDTTLDELAFDSLDTAELLIMVEYAFDVDLPYESLEKLKTIGHLTDLINETINF